MSPRRWVVYLILTLWVAVPTLVVLFSTLHAERLPPQLPTDGPRALPEVDNEQPVDLEPVLVPTRSTVADLSWADPQLLPIWTPPPAMHAKFCLLVCTSSHGQSWASAVHTPLLHSAIRSFGQAIRNDPARNETEFEVIVGLDHDDKWYLKHREELREKARQTLGGAAAVNFQTFEPRDRTPVSCFNNITRAAHRQRKCDFSWRLTDDMSIIDRKKGFAKSFMRALKSFDPPYVGVAGPQCRQGNTAILTSDVIHTTHLDIFGDDRYPPVFKNWHSDDWVTRVYGTGRTARVPDVEVIHHLNSMRYHAIDGSGLLPSTLKQGAERVERWVSDRK